VAHGCWAESAKTLSVSYGVAVGTRVSSRAPPHRTVRATVSTHAINPGLYKKMPYDPVHDFTPIGQVGVTPTLLGVHPSVPATGVKTLVALVKENPGKFTYGSSGLGSILHLCGEQFKALAGGLNIAHVPYRGSAPMMSDLVAGQISMAFDATPTALPQAQSGAIRAIGAGMATRMRAMPELPTLQEQGLKGFEYYTWNAILAPASTPQPMSAPPGPRARTVATPAIVSTTPMRPASQCWLDIRKIARNGPRPPLTSARKKLSQSSGHRLAMMIPSPPRSTRVRSSAPSSLLGPITFSLYLCQVVRIQRMTSSIRSAGPLNSAGQNPSWRCGRSMAARGRLDWR